MTVWGQMRAMLKNDGKREKNKQKMGRERLEVPESHGNSKPDKSVRDFPTAAAPLPKKRVRLRMKKRHEMQEIKGKWEAGKDKREGRWGGVFK